MTMEKVTNREIWITTAAVVSLDTPPRLMPSADQFERQHRSILQSAIGRTSSNGMKLFRTLGPSS